MIRDDLVASAITFLRDPSVSVSPIDKRKAFLKSKNLTDEEVEIALLRAGDDQIGAVDAAQYGSTGYPYSQQPNIRQPPPPPTPYGYGPYPAGPWAQPPAPPQRDWRDWFIMATVTGGVSYGLYTVAKRYVLPLIAPPTPPQLEQDKAAIDASFTHAFDLIDQLAKDSAALKAAEVERNEKLDTALRQVESVISEMKATNKRREEDSRRIGDEVRGLKEMIPKALEGWKAEEDAKLKELGNGLKSLKILVGNRVGDQASAGGPGRPFNIADRLGGGSGRVSPYDGYNVNGTEKQDESSSAPAPGVTVPKRESSSSGVMGYDGRPINRAAIPAWQMAAKENTQRSSKAVGKTTGSEGSAEESGDVVDA